MLRLSLACWDYDRTRALADGRVQPEGIDLIYLNQPVEETFFRMMRFQEFDASEMSLSSYVASLGGPLPYMVRLREIDRLTREAEAALAGRWRELADECRGDPQGFAARWREAARRWSFHELNDLIDRHNRWYPIEARLAMDVKRRDYVLVNGRPYRHERRDADWVLARFPPDLGEALRGPL